MFYPTFLRCGIFLIPLKLFSHIQMAPVRKLRAIVQHPDTQEILFDNRDTPVSTHKAIIEAITLVLPRLPAIYVPSHHTLINWNSTDGRTKKVNYREFIWIGALDSEPFFTPKGGIDPPPNIEKIPNDDGFNFLEATDLDWAELLVSRSEGKFGLDRTGTWYRWLESTTRCWQQLSDKAAQVHVTKLIGAYIDLKEKTFPFPVPREYKTVKSRVEKVAFAYGLLPLMAESLLIPELTNGNVCPDWIPLSSGIKIKLPYGQIEPIQRDDYFVCVSPLNPACYLYLIDRTRVTEDFDRGELAELPPNNLPEPREAYVLIRDFFEALSMNRDGTTNPGLYNWHIITSLYMLSGRTHWECFYNFYGSGSNGKSTLISALAAILGSGMAVELSNDTLHKRSFNLGGSHHTAHLIPLVSARLAYQDEVEDGPLAETFIRQITGDTPIPMRACGGEQFSAKLFLKVALGTNFMVTFAKEHHMTRRLRARDPNCKFVAEPVEPCERLKRPTFREFLKSPEGSAHLLFFLTREAKRLELFGNTNDLSGNEPPIPVEVQLFSSILQNNSERSILNDHLETFLKIKYVPSTDDGLTSTEVLQAFRAWCSPKGINVDKLTASALGKMLYNKVPNSSKHNVTKYQIQAKVES